MMDTQLTVLKKRKQCEGESADECQLKEAEESAERSNLDGSPTVLSDLPNELLVLILKHLPLDEQRILRSVNKRWQFLLNTPAFFQDVTLCNAATRGLRAVAHFLKIGVNHETKRLALTCTTRAPVCVLASMATAKTLQRKCPLLERITFANGKIPLDVVAELPNSIKLIRFSNVCLIGQYENDKIFKVIRGKKELKGMFRGQDRLRRIVALAGS